MTDTIVIVGASLAGGRAAESLRKLGHEGRIVLVGAEKDRPYDRPPLSKKAMRGQHPEEKLYFRAEDYYEANRIEVRFGTRAERLNGTAREVELAGGDKVAFDKLLIATGADARHLTCDGAGLHGIHYLRTLEDARAIRGELAPGKHVVIVGAGVIGMEVAASCREEGLAVTVLEIAPLPLVRAFGPDIGGLYGRIHRERGVDVRCGVGVASFRGNGRVEEVVTTTGQVIPCDFVVAGIGVVPATAWLEGSGVSLDRGVLVNEHCETTLAGVYAAGDVARFFSPRLGRYTMIESVENAQTQAGTAVNNILGKRDVHTPVPWFWSDQYELKLQSVGDVEGYDRVVYRGSVEDKAFAAFLLAGDRVKGVVGVNRLKEIAAAKKLISASIPVTDAMLADPEIPMSKVLAAGAPPAAG